MYCLATSEVVLASVLASVLTAVLTAVLDRRQRLYEAHSAIMASLSKMQHALEAILSVTCSGTFDGNWFNAYSNYATNVNEHQSVVDARKQFCSPEAYKAFWISKWQPGPTRPRDDRYEEIVAEISAIKRIKEETKIGALRIKTTRPAIPMWRWLRSWWRSRRAA